MIIEIEWWQDTREIALYDGYHWAVRRVDKHRSAEILGALLLEDFRRFVGPKAILDVVLSDGRLPESNPRIEASTADEASRASLMIRARAEVVRQSWRWVVLK